MDIGTPEAFYLVSRRGEAEPRTTDLTPYLEPIEWSGVETKAKAFLRPPAAQYDALARRLHVRIGATVSIVGNCYRESGVQKGGHHGTG